MQMLKDIIDEGVDNAKLYDILCVKQYLRWKKWHCKDLKKIQNSISSLILLSYKWRILGKWIQFHLNSVSFIVLHCGTIAAVLNNHLDDEGSNTCI